jgi:hypothetical protein
MCPTHVLTGGQIGVFGPILLHTVLPRKLSVIFTLLKQFGTGIILSTAFVHVSDILTMAGRPETNKREPTVIMN